MALGGRLDNKDFRVYVMISDGELQSGQIWEAAMAASQFKLDHLIVVVDNNLIQSDGVTKTIINIEPAEERWSAFGWEAQRINGHRFEEIHAAYEKCQALQGKPEVIIADTVKGKGVSFMENTVKWHSGPPSREEEQSAIKELCGEGHHD